MIISTNTHAHAHTHNTFNLQTSSSVSMWEGWFNKAVESVEEIPKSMQSSNCCKNSVLLATLMDF